MSSIIARDFFPSLERLEATNKYLDAVDSMDERQLEASVRRLIEVDSGRTPARYMDTPRQETPVFDRAETPRYGALELGLVICRPCTKMRLPTLIAADLSDLLSPCRQSRRHSQPARHSFSLLDFLLLHHCRLQTSSSTCPVRFTLAGRVPVGLYLGGQRVLHRDPPRGEQAAQSQALVGLGGGEEGQGSQD